MRYSQCILVRRIPLSQSGQNLGRRYPLVVIPLAGFASCREEIPTGLQSILLAKAATYTC